MRNRKTRWIFAMVMALTVLGAACAAEEEPADEGTETGTATEQAETDFLACQVTDTGGVDDKSFNQTAYAGLQRAEQDLGVEIKVLESTSDADFEPNIQTFIDQGCDLIVTVGFLLGDATAAAAEANPEQNFAIVDVDFFDPDKGEDVTYDNVKELTFATDQAAFLAGYLSAGTSESGTLGTFGGINIPPVTIFMNGFEAGMDHYNSEEGGNVRLRGWNSENQNGLFAESFEDLDKGRQLGQQLLDEGADVIMPVAGPVGLGTAEAVRDSGDASLVWVDTDGCESASEFCDLFLTSVMKNMDVAVFEAIQEAVDGNFSGGLYTGTLENDGVGIAPYHEFEDDVPQELNDAVEQLREDIIAGEIQVTE